MMVGSRAMEIRQLPQSRNTFAGLLLFRERRKDLLNRYIPLPRRAELLLKPFQFARQKKPFFVVYRLAKGRKKDAHPANCHP